MTINRERLADLFVQLCLIESPSGSEGRLAAFLKEFCAGPLGAAEILEDDSARVTGSDCGNLIISFPGSLPVEPLFFNCHMDTVRPCAGVSVQRREDRFYSDGSTILGADDKAGIAILLEVIRALRETGQPHGPVEFVFTTGEEVGLLGAKALDQALVRARTGYALDSTGTDVVVVGAPAANSISVQIHGVASHAGLHPELGVSAIQAAAKAIAELPLGRLDHESTANIGTIHGGTATNIVPDYVEVAGEVRSHSISKLASFTEQFEEIFQRVADDFPGAIDPSLPGVPVVRFSAPEQYPVMHLAKDCDAVRRVMAAARNLARELDFIVAGGGSDANVLNGKGLETAILGIGMTNVHSVDENIGLRDMVRTAELIASLLTTGRTG